jgi:HlyD family secretion protein
MKRWQKRLLILLAAAAAVLFLRFVLFRPEPVPVSVYTVDRGRVEDTVVNSRAGTVESRLRARMSPSLAGRVVAIPVKKGMRVTKGQVLLRLDDSEHRAQVTLAARSRDAYAAAAKEACLAAEQAGRDLKRAEGLAARNLLSLEGLETALTKSEGAIAACDAARERTRQGQAALDAARATLDKTTLAAPFDGVVLDITTEVGEWISPSPPGVFIPPVMDLIDPDSLYVSAPLDEADIARVELGLPVRITMDAFSDLSFPGRVTYIASYVETRQEQNRTLPIEAVFDERELPRNLLPGISADVEIILATRDAVVRVPSYALLEGNRVLVVEGGRLAAREVTVGLRNWEYTEIAQGLAEGDRVVVSLDRPEVKAGARVRVGGETGE